MAGVMKTSFSCYKTRARPADDPEEFFEKQVHTFPKRVIDAATEVLVCHLLSAKDYNADHMYYAGCPVLDLCLTQMDPFDRYTDEIGNSSVAETIKSYTKRLAALVKSSNKKTVVKL